MTRAKRNGHGNKFSKRIALAVKAEREAIELSDDISTLAEWLRRDILALAGDDFNCRRELMDREQAASAINLSGNNSEKSSTPPTKPSMKLSIASSGPVP